MSLGAFFPEQTRKEFARENIRVGSVIKSHIRRASKEKRWVIVAINTDFGMIACTLINSEVNINVFPTEELQALHLPLIKGEDKPYIDYDCFLDCSEIVELSYDEVATHLEEEPGCHLGQMGDKELGATHQLLKSARTISPRVKRMYGISGK